MFSALSQGNIVHILDKSDGLKYKVGEVIGHKPNNTFGSIGSSSLNPLSTFLTLKVKVDGNVIEYPEIPANNSVASYNNSSIIISETKEGIASQVESIVQTSKHYLSEDFIKTQKKNIADGEEILKVISPQFAKDKERDDRIDTLDSKITGMENKLDKILSAISTNNLKV